jgi:hypothetical protein
MAEKTIYTLINNASGIREGAYSRAYYTQYEFGSARAARASNVNEIFKDKRRYRVQKWKVTYELINDDVDPYRQETIPYMKDVNTLKKDRRKYQELFDEFYMLTTCGFEELNNLK